jgi:hypothetical protein
MALLAHLTATTRLCWVNGDARTRVQRVKFPIFDQARADFFDNAGKFMSQGEGGLDWGVADTRVLIGM